MESKGSLDNSFVKFILIANPLCRSNRRNSNSGAYRSSKVMEIYVSSIFRYPSQFATSYYIIVCCKLLHYSLLQVVFHSGYKLSHHSLLQDGTNYYVTICYKLFHLLLSHCHQATCQL